MSAHNRTNNHGQKRKRSDAGFLEGKGKKEARKTDSEHILSHAPQSVKIVDYVENRATEILALTSHVEKIGGTKLVSQRLPRHMRRRALSHDIRRLPKRLREAAAKEIERASTTKRPSRKHRRRPKNLTSDYERRQRKITWLETHIWHAKRFRMIDKWGYRLALHPNDKSIRACHRAADKYSLLQDVSFECCLEITGTEEVIRKCLRHVVSDKTGPTVLAKQYLKGSKWGETVMFACDQYPCEALGKVSFLWRPPSSDDSSERQLWIWSHPASFECIWRELRQSIILETGCKLEELDSKQESEKHTETKSISITVEDSNDNTDNADLKPDLRNLIFVADEIKLRSLKDAMPKFRLTGQTSQAILSEVLQFSDVGIPPNEGDLWWQKYYTNDTKQKIASHQKVISDWLTRNPSPGEVSPCQVVALTVRDPRLLLPSKRIKIMQKMEVPQVQPFPTATEASSLDSPLWDSSIRTEVKASKMSDHELNKKRGQNLVPGTPVNLGLEESRIPVLLLQRPGYRSTVSTSSRGRLPQRSVHQGFGCGWDVIVPPGWGTAFHIAFVFRGCRVGGLRESHAVFRESGNLDYPADFPDTPAGRLFAEEQRDELQKKYDRNPPAKRPNYAKMGIRDPFICPWNQLVEEWRKTSGLEVEVNNKYIVQRTLKNLKLLNEAFTFEHKVSGSNLSRFEVFCGKAELEELLANESSSLVSVRITMHGKGVPSQFAHVCIPKAEDFESLNKDSERECPCEPKHSDPEGANRRREKKLKKKLKKSKIIHLQTALANPANPMEAALAQMLENKNTSNKSDEETCVTVTNGLVQDSPAKPMLINSACRQIIGFVNDGDFSLGQGQGHGKAFCSQLGLLELLRQIPANKPCLILVRNTTSLQYRFAWLSAVL